MYFTATHWKEDWVSLVARLEMVGEIKIGALAENQTPVVHPQASHCTEFC